MAFTRLRRSAGVAIAVAMAAPLAACSPPKPPAQPPPLVSLASPSTDDFADQATYQSTLEAIRELKLEPQIEGRIVLMPMTEGQRVRAGQLLFRLDQVQQQAQVNASSAEARKDRLNAERYIFLNEQGAVSTKDRDAYVTQAIESRDRVIASSATLGYKDVLAPIAGEVGNINAKLGDVVRPGTVVTTVVDNSRLWVRLDIPSELSWRVKPGLPVLLEAPGRPGLLARGSLSFIAPSVDKNSQTLLVKATFANPDGTLRNGQRVSATLVFDRQTRPSIPQQAVLLQAGKTFVFLAVQPAEASRLLGRPITPEPPAGALVALQVPVNLGSLQNGRFAVRSGIAARDRVIVGNLAQLRSGAVVRVAPAGTGAGGSGS
ncbi:efflux RND transporter periplasmic adaptor subunit [Vulcanococcus limneticus Candia 3F8]|uniref:efflux RND transporter periplasmic adaptor subunit n=2 Tax=Vulcanococcus limneticus TaxID=2170428 RepID=UPI000B999EA6|nr:efflux RND transporter periplasmic adaptor subunit [Vulcanococcus limneticus]MCP9792034.1 efflux RND transporter periplasmic adaptor subunit [Vulcanococcus limneticus MW73D5]MCP9893101.1 efflux RND transporter periplasmic adaptor subunit [Vulcanococcus limneticus Candia 3F8]MCP9897433.1 efflux RND transporter periplasmic adaptor subunit [Vulcanococcus limneticus Candia 3B3]